jgi:hypothetical protein
LISASDMEPKQKIWAYIKRQWRFGLVGMQYSVYVFGGHPILSADLLCSARLATGGFSREALPKFDNAGLTHATP